MSIADKLTVIAENQQRVYEAGKAAGGYSDGYEAGRYDEWDLFWETYQQGGARTEYADSMGFGRFTDETFKPKYTVWCTSSGGSFFRNSPITNYEALKMVDFSKATQWNDMFRGSKITHLGVLDTRGRSNPYNLYQLFYNARIETIDKLIVREDGKTNFQNVGWGKTLKDIEFEGVIGVDPYFKDCINLTHASLMSTIEHLMDYSGTETAKTLNLGSTNLAKLTEEDIAIATQKGWTVA